MPRPARPFVLLGVLVCAAVASFPAAGAGNRSVLHYGDSLAVGTDLYLDRYLRDWTVRSSTDVSRHAAEAPSALAALGPSLPRVVVLSVGTNDDPGAVSEFRRIVRRTVGVVGPSRCVVWATIVRPPYRGVSYSAYNRVLHVMATRYSNLIVLDWAGLARAHPGWFGRDGVHPSMAGYKARAAATARLVERCIRLQANQT